MLKLNKPDLVVTSHDLNLNPNLDCQGVEHTSPADKDSKFLGFALTKGAKIQPSSSSDFVRQPLLNYQYFYRIREACLYHFQLHEVLKPVSDTTLAYLHYNGIAAFNMANLQRRNLLSFRNLMSFDYSQKHAMISGVYSTNGHNYRTLLYSVRNSKFEFTDNVYVINNIIGKIDFVDFLSNRLFASGNAKYGSLIDMEKGFAETKIASQAFINNHEFNNDDRLIGMALDDSFVQISSENQKSLRDSVLFKAHKGWALGIKHLTGQVWASGGEDCAIKIWDIRNYSSPVKVIKDCFFVPVAFEYDQNKSMLFALEMYGVLRAFQFSQGFMLEDSVKYTANSGGIVCNQKAKTLHISLTESKQPGENGIMTLTY